MDNFVKEHGKINILFQDSSHHFIHSKMEWFYYSKFMAEGGVWVCDDISEAFHDPKVDPEGYGMVEYFKGIPIKQKRLYKSLRKGSTLGIILF